MIQAHTIKAIVLRLNNLDEAVLVQDGPEWNSLRKFKCIAPANLSDAVVIATRDEKGSPLSTAFGTLFNLDNDEKWLMVMCSPALASLLKRD